jgi:hypothetical protein
LRESPESYIDSYGKINKNMDDNDVSKPSAVFVIKDLFKQAEDLGLRHTVPSQTKLTLNDQGLGLRFSTGTQDEPKTKKTTSPVKSKARKVKHTIGSIMQHWRDLKQTLATSDQTEDNRKKPAAEMENKDPNAITEEKTQETGPPFVVDLLTQLTQQELGTSDEESTQSPSCSTATFLGGWESGGWTNTPENWVRVFQARSTEGGADFFVDRRGLGEVASVLFRDLTSEFSATEKLG